MLSILLTVMILGITTGGETPTLAEISTVELRDQHGIADSLEADRGRVVVAMVVTAKRLCNIRPWERDLSERFLEVEFFRVADVPPDSPADYDRISGKLRERLPAGVSVLIDLERRWAIALGLDTGRPNILLIDRRGKLVATHRERHDPELAAVVADDLRKIIDGP